jgi:hypothetical protein
MRDYWACTKFADIIRGCKKPEALSSKDWRAWNKKCKEDHPIRFWIAEEALDKIQNFLYYPIDKAYNVKCWFLNRFVTKTHALTSNLKRGEYHEIDTRIIHCLFDELVNFVEVEKAWMQVAWGHEDDDSPWWSVGWFRTRTFRSAKLGLKYLEWETTLTNEDGTLTPQAETAKVIIDMYNWWKFIRPGRPDPYDVSGWSEYCSKFGTFLDLDDDDVVDTMPMHKKIDEIETAYFDEDTRMLNKLIEIRATLWT